MEEIVRFVVVRPAEPTGRHHAIQISASLAGALDEAAHSETPATRFATVSSTRRTQIGIRDVAGVPHGAELIRLAAELRASETVEAASARAAQILNGTFAELASRREPMAALDPLSDLFACYKFGGRSEPALKQLEQALRALLVIRALASGAKASPREMMDWPIVISDAPRRRTVAVNAAIERPDPTAKRPALVAAISDHRNALEELESFETPDLARPAASPSSGMQSRLVLNARTRSKLSAPSRQVMSARGIDLDVEDVGIAEERLVTQLRSLETELEDLDDEFAPRTRVARIGGAVYQITNAPDRLEISSDALMAIPVTHGEMVPVGIGDLLVVRQQMIGYQAADISHVENAMRGEHKSREHKRGQIIETTDSEETEMTREEERDQQSTERNELQREAAQSLEEQLSMHLGTSLSGSYGPSVQFSINADLGMEQSKEQSSKFAQTVSKEATQRAASKVTERVKRSTTRKVTDTVEETNIHEIDNKGSSEHVTGVYQWLDKLYRAQVFNYGQRQMFDLVVPEPAAQLLHFAANAPAPDANIEKPKPFTASAKTIGLSNYMLYAHRYDAVDVPAPPEKIRTVSKVLEGMDEDVERGVTHQIADLPIPEGYQAVDARVAVDFWHNNDAEKPAEVVAIVSGHILNFDKDTRARSVTLSNEQGSIGIAMHTFHTPSVVVSVTIDCQRTRGAMTAWRLAAHASIKQGYLKKVADYETKVARAKAEAGALAAAQPVRPTQEMIRAELKRCAISMLTRQHFTLFNSVDDSGTFAKIRFDQADAEGPYIRFFEQAFEWEQMMYVFYPYFWGRRSEWKAKLSIGEFDPDFDRFLKAGAARLVIPVRPRFEEAVLHFLETGQVWQGGEPPNITSPQYVHVVEELKAQTGAPGQEVAVGEPWTVRLPTQLIALRTLPGLPAWTQQADGSWQPV